MSYSQSAGQTNSSIPNTADSIVIAIVLLTLSLLVSACSSTQRAEPVPAATTQEVESSTALVEQPAQIDQNLAKVLDALLDSEEFQIGRWGVALISLRDGKLVYQRNGSKLFTPASNMKVYTTSVALDLLGADYRWRTSVYSTVEPDASGTINGDLILYGRGAPDLVSTNRSQNQNSLEELASSLAKRGVKRVRGNVIGDESYFRGSAIGEGWQWNDLQWYFGAEASALSVNANSADISITSATQQSDKPSVVVNDNDGYVKVTNNVATVDGGSKFRIGVHRGLSDNNVVVWGEFPFGSRGYGVNLSVHRPSLWAARLFVRALQAQGISVDGIADARDSRVPENERFNPEGKSELASTSGKSLGEIVHATNKLSVNLYAELILRTLGRERGSLLPSQDLVGRERGDEEAGASIVRLWLSRSGIKTRELAILDGSGLSRLDLVTPESTARLLEAIHRTYSGQMFLDSLPVAGVDGTLGGRLKSVEGRVLAKTGSLTFDNSLSGYLTGGEGQIFAFSVFCNDFLGQGTSISLIDRLVTTIANYPKPPPKKEIGHLVKPKP
jgi:serine-type D-Ala-D-Ala carboxypeptidase/endopeptidase (penicillin-binding protein 4)